MGRLVESNTTHYKIQKRAIGTIGGHLRGVGGVLTGLKLPQLPMAQNKVTDVIQQVTIT